MKIINFIGNSSAIVIIGTILIFGILEKKNVFLLFSNGVKQCALIILELFPTNVPAEILPLAILRPISGSTAMAIGMDIMQKVRSRLRYWKSCGMHYGSQ